MNARDRVWQRWAIAQLQAEQGRTADTHLIRVEWEDFANAGIDLYFKDESTHPSGSLKHRLARSLFLYALCNECLHPGQAVIEASSGSTAISEAYFARLLNLPFYAVLPESTVDRKQRAITALGGRLHLVPNGADVEMEAGRLAERVSGYFMDQFTFAERATDWRGNNNIAQSLFDQLRNEPHPVPHAIVVGAGTGGTSATIGRFLRYQGLNSQLILVDPEGSVLSRFWQDRDRTIEGPGSEIEGIGRPRVPASFLPNLIDQVIEVSTHQAWEHAEALNRKLMRGAGPSTGANLVGCLAVMRAMKANGQQGSVVSLICDAMDRYA
jgi:cysteine synthase A